MRFYFYSTAVFLLGVATLVGCNSAKKPTAQASQKAPQSTTGPETMYADGARRVTIAELKTLMEKGEAFVVDVRNQQSWDAGHIPGSIMIPSGEILEHVNKLPKDKLIVTYCS